MSDSNGTNGSRTPQQAFVAWVLRQDPWLILLVAGCYFGLPFVLDRIERLYQQQSADHKAAMLELNAGHTERVGKVSDAFTREQDRTQRLVDSLLRERGIGGGAGVGGVVGPLLWDGVPRLERAHTADAREVSQGGN